MFRPLPVAALGLLAFAASAPVPMSGADSRSGFDTVVAEINGMTLTMADLEAKYSTALFQAYTSYYDAQRKLVDELIDERLLRQQAEKENVTVEQLLAKHVNNAVSGTPSEEALRFYYEGVDTTEAYEAVRDKIIDAVKQRRIAKVKAAYLQSLRDEWRVAIRLRAPRMTIPLKDTAIRGQANARVVLVEYADYECPYCQQVQPAIERLEKEYKGKVAFAYKDFPLPMHPNAQKAAEATRCAQAQGKYWEYHDLLESSKQLEQAALKNHARTLKLDTTAFDKCLDNNEEAQFVKAHQAEAQALGLQGTPTFFVNGRYVSGTPTYERLRGIIAEELIGTAETPSGVPVNDAHDGKVQPK